MLLDASQELLKDFRLQRDLVGRHWFATRQAKEFFGELNSLLTLAKASKASNKGAICFTIWTTSGRLHFFQHLPSTVNIFGLMVQATVQEAGVRMTRWLELPLAWELLESFKSLVDLFSAAPHLHNDRQRVVCGCDFV